MITNTGKNILAKYLIGQAPAYASYIAIGCGAKPLVQLSGNVIKTSIVDGVATITVDQDHGFSSGQNIVISNSLQSNIDSVYLGSHTISSVVSSDVFTYNIDSSDLDEELISPSGNVSVDFSDKINLDFEMFRVPISSRGYVTEDGVSKIVMTADLPTEERYEITEVGVYSAGSNTAAGSYDSKTIYSFSSDENWEYHGTGEEIHSVYSPLDSDGDGIITGEYLVNGVLTDLPVFQTNADNRIFTDPERVSRHERCRFLNNVIAIRGNEADITTLVESGKTNLVIGDGSTHIHLTGASLDFNKNSPLDQLRLAFSVINKDGSVSPAAIPDTVRILVEFSSTDTHNSGEYARFQVDLNNGKSSGEHDFELNRYVVVSKELQELKRSSGFTWSSVDVVKIYACVIKDSLPSEDFYICLDALRLENVATSNPLYGLSGYSIIKNTNAEPIVKSAYTTNFIEFRFAMDVQ